MRLLEAVAELRRRGLPCVEVDLSAVPRLATREAHACAILHEAPRRWLFNASIARAEAERARRAGRHARFTEAIVAAWAASHRLGDPAWVRWAHDAGLGEIVRTYTSISRQGGKLKLLNVSKRIYDLLVITKLVTIFDSYEDEAEAVKSFAS